MTVVFALLVAWFATAALLVVADIGRQRRPITPLSALCGVVLYAAIIVGVWWLWAR